MTSSTATTLLAFDFGMKRIGVAVGQTLTKTASPLKTLAAKDGEPDWAQVKALAQEWDVNGFVVGIPLNMDGSEQFTTHAARRFANQLKKRFELPCYRVDERLTTKAVRDELFEAGGYKAIKNAEVDSLAAQLLLEQWFQSQGDN